MISYLNEVVMRLKGFKTRNWFQMKYKIRIINYY